jgi:ABC-type multidrug transport system fused ATPase/permease subunit
VDPNNGTIFIDGVDISKVRRNTVRERLICLPQDPLIFPGTFRFNLDPTSKVSEDNVLIDVLKVVCLWTLVTKRGGLSAELKMESLSHGEQQLLALARAIVRKQIAGSHCILVLDEATSNLDRETETLIQTVIKKEFKNNTVITVAHRLETVAESDYIVMLEKGKVTKIGPPAEVL